MKNPALAEGIRLYDALDYAGALQSLTLALDRPSNRADTARVHLYIGLIQHRYKLKLDAEASFLKALEHDPRVRVPKGTPQSARQLFRKIKKDQTGVDDEAPDPPPKKKKPPKQRESDPDPSDSLPAGDDEEPRPDPPKLQNSKVEPEPTPVRAEDPPRREAPAVRDDPNKRLTPAVATNLEEDRSPPIAGWIAIGIGGAAAATAITFGILSGQNGSEALQEPVASRAEELHSLAVQQRTLAIVSGGVSIAALGVAAMLFLSDD